MIEENLFQVASTVIYALIQLIIIAAAIILVIKKVSIATVLLLTGAILSGLMQIIIPIVYANYLGLTDDFLSLNFLMNLISSIFYAIFGVGLLLLAINYKKA